eukprot:257514_1
MANCQYFQGSNSEPTVLKKLRYNARRSPILSRYGMACSSQPIVSEIGASILKDGGNAIDAAIGMHFALSVVEPMSTGLGGDCFMLYYDNKTKTVSGLNGSGKTSSSLTSKHCEYYNTENILASNPLNITVPGNVGGMLDALHKFGTMSRERIISPAISLAINGWPVTSITSHYWNKYCKRLNNCDVYNNSYELLMPNTQKPPKQGDIMTNKYIANTLRKLMVYGKNEYYNGSISDAIVDIVQKKKGILTKQDLRNHKTLFVEPIKTRYKNFNIWQIPPNGQGIAALMALNFYESKRKQIINIETNNLNKYIQ